MPHQYLRTVVTPAVSQAQDRMGSRVAMERLVAGWDTEPALGPDELAFIAERDSFYLATVGETGWPYVQHRGGPAGFVHALGERTLAWADVRGNRQYVSTGNLSASPKASLLFMDYARQRRLKVLGTIELVAAGADPARVESVDVPGLDARIEQVMTLHVEAWDWNCPQHITQRWTKDELDPVLAPLRRELAELRAENASLRAASLG